MAIINRDGRMRVMIYLLRLIAWLTRNKLHIAIAGKNGVVLIAGKAVRDARVTSDGIRFRYHDGLDTGRYGCSFSTTSRAIFNCDIIQEGQTDER